MNKTKTLKSIKTILNIMRKHDRKNVIDYVYKMEKDYEGFVDEEMMFTMDQIIYQFETDNDFKTIQTEINILKQYNNVPLCSYYITVTNDKESDLAFLCALLSLYINIVSKLTSKGY